MKMNSFFNTSLVLFLLNIISVTTLFAVEKGTLKIVDSSGKDRKITKWNFEYTCYDDTNHQIKWFQPLSKCFVYPAIDSSHINLLRIAARKAGDEYGHIYSGIIMLVPFSSIRKIDIVSPAKSKKTGKVKMVLEDGTEEKVHTDVFCVTGSENLGELGSSEYHGCDNKMKTIYLPNVSNPASWYSLLKSKDSNIPATVIDRSGKEYVLDDLQKYGTRSNCTYAFHMPCDCGETAYLSSMMYFKRGENQITLNRAKISSISFQNIKDWHWKVRVTLLSGNVYDMLYEDSYDSYFIGKIGNRYMLITIALIKTIKFGKK